MSTIATLSAGQPGDTSRTDINANFAALNADKLETTAYTNATTSAAGKTRLSTAPVSASIPIAVGDNDPRVPTVAQVGYIPTSDEKAALDGTGTPSVSSKYVTDDDTSATPTANKVVRYDSSGLITYSSSVTDATFPNGEAVTAGQAVFIEIVPTFAVATSVQNIGDVSGNTRISFPIFGTGVAGTTFTLSLKKTVSPSATFSFRIETDNAGSPSGTTVTNGTGTLAAGSITTSFVDTTLTLDGSVTLTAGVRYHIVCFAGTYASETVNGTNYFNIGYSTNNTTTRPSKTWNGTVWSSAVATTFCYAGSTIFNGSVLSLTDADFTYKVNVFGISSETKAVGLFPKITIVGINTNQSALTTGSTYYLSGTPGSISTSSNNFQVGTAISATQIQINTLITSAQATISGTTNGSGILSGTATVSGLLTIYNSALIPWNVGMQLTINSVLVSYWASNVGGSSNVTCSGYIKAGQTWSLQTSASITCTGYITPII